MSPTELPFARPVEPVTRDETERRGTPLSWASGEALPLVVLLGAGLGSAGIYLAMTARMSLPAWFPGPKGITLDFVQMMGPDWRANALELYAQFAALLVLWALALAATPLLRGRWTAYAVFGVPALFVLVLAWLYPPQAVDFFHNIADGRHFWRFDGNPMTTGPGAFFPIGMSYGDEASAYGPLWYLLMGPPVLLGSDDVLRSMVLLKLWMGGLYLAAAALTWLIARRLTPGREWFAVVLLAWNPFVVIRVLGNGHNDVAMMLFVLLAVWLAVERRWLWLPVALAAAVLIKYIPLLVAPAFLVYALRQPRAEWRPLFTQLAIGSLIALALAVAAFAPFWAGADTFGALRKQATGWGFITSTPMLVEYQLQQVFSLTQARSHTLAQRGCAAVFLVLAAWLFLRQRRGGIALVATAASVLLLYVLIAAGWFRPWYLLWPLMLTPLLPGRWWPLVTIAASAGGLTPDIIEQYRNNIMWLRPHFFWLIAAPVVTTFFPIVVTLTAAYILTGRRELSAAASPAGTRS